MTPVILSEFLSVTNEEVHKMVCLMHIVLLWHHNYPCAWFHVQSPFPLILSSLKSKQMTVVHIFCYSLELKKMMCTWFSFTTRQAFFAFFVISCHVTAYYAIEVSFCLSMLIFWRVQRIHLWHLHMAITSYEDTEAWTLASFRRFYYFYLSCSL